MKTSLRLSAKLLLYLSQTELTRNRKFKDLHRGESCYIFGNGISLKTMDLKRFNDKIAIGCNTLFIHNDFNKLDCHYYQIPAPFFFFPYRRYYGKLQRNYIGDLYRKKITEHKHIHFFTSLSNCFNMRGEHVYYTHHFGCRDWNLDDCTMDGVFSFMSGATHAMLGTAIYMGFHNAVLVGCDYAFTPVQTFHFFEKGKGAIQKDLESPYGRLFEDVRKRINVTTIVQAGMVSSVSDYVEYEKYVKCSSTYRENTEIIDKWCLDLLAKQGTYNIY